LHDDFSRLFLGLDKAAAKVMDFVCDRGYRAEQVLNIMQSPDRTSAVRRHFRPLAMTFPLQIGLQGVAEVEKA